MVVSSPYSFSCRSRCPSWLTSAARHRPARAWRDEPLHRHALADDAGAYSVHVSVEGAGGTGTVMVPVNNMATERKQMAPAFGATLIVLGGFLFLTAVKLVGAAWGEAVLKPTEHSARPVRVRSALAMTASALPFASLVVGGRRGGTPWTATSARIASTARCQCKRTCSPPTASPSCACAWTRATMASVSERRSSPTTAS